MIFEKLPSVRQVIFSVLWLQIAVAIFTLWASNNKLYDNISGPKYVTKELEDLPSEQQVHEFTDKVVPVLKEDKQHPRQVELPEDFTERLKFELVTVDGLGAGILVSGPIETGDTERFITFLKDNNETKFSFVSLHSPGGPVSEALSLGREVRSRSFKTFLSNTAFCYSACPYVMASGVERIFSDYSLLGVHQHYYEANLYIPLLFAVNDIQNSQADVFRYLKEMGVSTDLMEHSLSTPPDEIYILKEQELFEYKFATRMFETA